MTALEHIRRRSKTALCALLPLLTVAWLDAAVASCVGMAASADASGAAVDHRSVVDHESQGTDGTTAHHAHDTYHPGPRPAPHHEQQATARDDPHEAPPLERRGPQHAGPQHEQQAPAHDHGDCPHCPPGSLPERGDAPEQGRTAHVACDTVDSAAAKARGGAFANWDLKHALPTASCLVPAPSIPSSGVDRAAAQAVPTPTRLSLNVRYCVFLI